MSLSFVTTILLALGLASTPFAVPGTKGKVIYSGHTESYAIPSSGIVYIGSSTISVGGPAVTLDSVQFSLGGSGGLYYGSSTTELDESGFPWPTTTPTPSPLMTSPRPSTSTGTPTPSTTTGAGGQPTDTGGGGQPTNTGRTTASGSQLTSGITTSGSTTKSTTTSSTTTTTGTITMCASDTCGKLCSRKGGTLSGSAVVVRPTSLDCAQFSTTTVSALPTVGSASMTTVPPEPIPTETSVPAQKRTDDSLVKRTFPDLQVGSRDAHYVSALSRSTEWIDQLGDVHGEFREYDNNGGLQSLGVNGIYGCTSVIVASEKGVFISHIWEVPVFINGDWSASPPENFENAINILLNGDMNTKSLLQLVGTDQQPGPLHAQYSPIVYVVTPFTTPYDPMGVTTTLRYQDRAQYLAKRVFSAVPGPHGQGVVTGYHRTDLVTSTAQEGSRGRAIWEYDPHQSWMTTTARPGTGIRVGRYRLWVEDRLILWQDCPLLHSTQIGAPSKRDIGYESPCGNNTSSSTSTSSATSTTSQSVSSTTKSSSTSADTATTAAHTTTTAPPPPPPAEDTCNTKYKYWYEQFAIYGKDFDPSKFGTKGSGLKEQIKGCGALTKWKFKTLTHDPEGYKWEATGHLPIDTGGCIGRAVVSAGGSPCEKS